MAQLVDYITSMDSTQLVVSAGVAVAAIFSVKTLIGNEQGHRKLLEQQKRLQSVEIGTARPGEGRAHRKPGYDNKILTRYDERITTAYEMFRDVVSKYPDEGFLGTRKKLSEKEGDVGDYEWMTYKQVAQRCENFGSGIIAEFGHKPGDLIGIYSINRPEWLIADIAGSHFSWPTIALYDTLGQNAVEFIIKHAEIKIVVAAKKQIKTLLAAKPNCPTLKAIISMDKLDDQDRAQAANVGLAIFTVEEIEKKGALAPQKHVPPKAEDIYTIMYTSGTTGDPKGVILTHGNLIAEVSGVLAVQKDIFSPSDVHMSYLPLAHSFERAVCYSMVRCGAKIGYYQGNINFLFNDIAALRPTFLVGAPRVWTRLHDKLLLTIDSGSAIKKALFHYGFNAKKNALKHGSGAPLWDTLVFSKIKARLGGRVKFILSGSAPLDPKLGEFLKVCFCCPVIEGYGLTENFAGCAITNLDETQFGHVGAPFACTEIKLVDVPEMEYSSKNNPPTGEIMLRGANVFRGYYKDPEKTKEAFDDEGWFHTGDIGRWNPNGTLSIIDRKKNIFKLSQGEYVAVEYLESIYLRSPFVAQIWVYGSSYKRFLVAVVVPDIDYMNKWAAENNISGDLKAYCENPKVKTLIMDDLNRMAKDSKLQGFEFVKAIHLSSEPFSVDNDQMTPSFKLRRAQLLKAYQTQVDEMYVQIGE